MDSVRFNNLVDRVRMIRFSNKMSTSDGWESADLLQHDMDINALIEEFCTARFGSLKPCGILKTLPGDTSLHHKS